MVGSVSAGSPIQLGQDLRAITGQLFLEADSEMISMQEISWGVVLRLMVVGEGREQDWAEGGTGLRYRLSEASADSTGVLELGGPFRVVSSWGEGAAPLQPVTDQSLGMERLEKRL